MTRKVVDITTKEDATQVAKETVANIEINFKDGKQVNVNDIIGYQVGGGAVVVATQRGTDSVSNIWNFAEIANIIHTVKEVE